MHTSYFLFVMVITLMCYALVRGRPTVHVKVKQPHYVEVGWVNFGLYELNLWTLKVFATSKVLDKAICVAYSTKLKLPMFIHVLNFYT